MGPLKAGPLDQDNASLSGVTYCMKGDTPPLPTAIEGVIDDVQRMVELHVKLAKQELLELARDNAIAAGLLTAGGLLVLLGVLVALPVLVIALIPAHVIAALVWLCVYLGGGTVLLVVGRARLRIQKPDMTIHKVQEEIRWATRRAKSVTS